MQLNNELLQKYVGGQVEVQNQLEKYIFRGEIKNISIENEEFFVECSWLAQGLEYPPIPTSWKKVENKPYQANLGIYSTNMLDSDRICISSSITGELVILFPLGGSILDYKKVLD